VHFVTGKHFALTDSEVSWHPRWWFAAARGNVSDRAGFAAGGNRRCCSFAIKPMPGTAVRAIRRNPLLAQRHRPRERQPPSRTP